jgi:cytochrome c oxidase cbb3-type subunit 2
MPSKPADPHTPTSSAAEGWQGIVLIAATYIYFLIFAQFGFLKRLSELGIGDAALPVVMGAMAVGGIGMSLLAPRSRLWNCPSCRVQTGLIGCLLAALWALLPLNLLTAVIVAFTIGGSLGLLTVTLVANLPLWIGTHRPLFKIALGTGIGYFACNVPALFTATPLAIALTSAGGCLLALIVANRSQLLYLPPSSTALPREPRVPFALVLAWFTALVWLDSAAFYIIQNVPQLKAGTWQGDAHLWRAAALHLAAALLSAWLLARRGLSTTLALALGVLAAACLLLLDPSRVPLAGVLYPVGVSLYSVALVAYPAFLLTTNSADVRARRAGSLYAVAGWVGSAMGIGMARNLHHVPAAFVAAAAALFLLPWLWNAARTGLFDRALQVQLLAIMVVLAAAFALTQWLQPPARPLAASAALTPAERGRRVYIAEGCINCHSQYVRPHTADVLMWGPVTSVDEIHRQQPPLIGNRRQGPDLSQVGNRRSPLWLRIHFLNPRNVSYQSPMPRFDYLFGDSRGDDLIAYLGSLDASGHWQAIAGWQPAADAWEQAEHIDGAQLFAEHCATCHDADGAVRHAWASSFRRLPPDLVNDRLMHVDPGASALEQRVVLARIVKFGIEGTDMAGHEYLPDAQVAALAGYVLDRHGSVGP